MNEPVVEELRRSLEASRALVSRLKEARDAAWERADILEDRLSETQRLLGEARFAHAQALKTIATVAEDNRILREHLLAVTKMLKVIGAAWEGD